jgi:hypothetical protein
MKKLVGFFLVVILIGCGTRKVEIEKVSEIEKKDFTSNVRVTSTEIVASGKVTRTFVYEPIDNTKPAYVNGKELINGKLTDTSIKEDNRSETKRDSLAEVKYKGIIKKKKKSKKTEKEEGSKIWIFWLGILALIYFLVTFYIKPKNLIK